MSIQLTSPEPAIKRLEELVKELEQVSGKEPRLVHPSDVYTVSCAYAGLRDGVHDPTTAKSYADYLEGIMDHDVLYQDTEKEGYGLILRAVAILREISRERSDQQAVVAEKA